MTTPMHACPGRCGGKVGYHLLACKPCWGRPPKELKVEIEAAYWVRRQHPQRHRKAVQAALGWYRDNRPAGAS